MDAWDLVNFENLFIDLYLPTLGNGQFKQKKKFKTETKKLTKYVYKLSTSFPYKIKNQYLNTFEILNQMRVRNYFCVQ